jgi:N-methylhydantoinase B/oxoprolinase/acetone carboxylase alpha subunit
MIDHELVAASAVLLDRFAAPVAGPGFARKLGKGVAFSDDLIAHEQRLAVRVRIDDAPQGWRIDLRDSSTRAEEWMVASADDAKLAAMLAFGAFGVDAGSIVLELDASTWVGGERHSVDPCFRAFAITRIYDAIAAALEKAWPDRGRAGSCSLGAIVVAKSTAGVLVDVVAGGRGGSASDPGETWGGPLLPATTLRNDAAITISYAPREKSGGFGARSGGDGTIARYQLREEACVRVAIDRRSNPPHGLDRAGNGGPSSLVVIDPDGTRRELAPWRAHLLERGNVIEVATAGGGGHGFPGWGDIDWDPSRFEG